MAASNSVRIELLNKENFETWKIQMEALLIKNDAWSYVSGQKEKPAENRDNATAIVMWEVADSKAKSDIILAISPAELKLVKGCSTSKEVWQKLENFYQSKGPARKATLLKKLTLHRLEDGGDVHEHLRLFFDTVDKLQDLEIVINEDLLTVMILYSLPPSYENFRCAIESRDDLPKPSALRVKILEETDARKNETRSATTNAMFVRNQNGSRGYKKYFGDKRERQYEEKAKFKFKCHRCHKIGHKAAECRSSFVNSKKEENRSNDAKMVTDIGWYTFYEDLTENTVKTHEANHTTMERGWCLDSGSSAHLCGNSDNFTKLERKSSGKLNLANNGTTDINGVGTINIITESDGSRRVIKIQDALHVPDLRTNLLSVGKIADKGYKIIFQKDEAKVVDTRGNTVAKADRINGLYYLREHQHNCDLVQECKNARNHKTNELEMWHRRLGHLNVSDLTKSIKNQRILGINVTSTDTKFDCDVCLRGKLTRAPFPGREVRGTELLEIVHSDLCGPMRVTSKGGAKYFATFIDDYSRWCEVYILKSKNEILDAFKKFKASAENSTGKKIKYLQSDNGTEYLNNRFDEFLNANGIKRRLTVTYCPEQNGTAERKNRTLVEMARCLMIQSGLPSSFWAEALCTANYTRNQCPTSTLQGETPFFKWHGKKPNVKHFREFGCEVYTLNRNPAKGKFDERGKKGIFLGYSGESKAFRVWLPEERKVDITRDVRFVEQIPRSTQYKDSGFDNEKEDIDFPIIEEKEPDSQEEEILEPDASSCQSKRGRGRPRKILTGRRGRPVKQYQLANNPIVENSERIVEEDIVENSERIVEEVAELAEIPLDDALGGTEADEWMKAIVEEMRSILKNETWKVVDRPSNREVIGSRIVLRDKCNEDGTLIKRKARVVAKGYSQRPGIDFDLTFAPVARISSVRTLTALAAQHNLEMKHLDVATAYLNGSLEEEIYMEIPPHIEKALKKLSVSETQENKIKIKAKKMLKELSTGNKVCLLQKALYGLRQAGRCWHEKIKGVLTEFGLKQSTADNCVFYSDRPENMFIVAVYVDDIIVVSGDRTETKKFKKYLIERFDIRDLGNISYCLGIEFSRTDNEILITQRNYIKDLLKRFCMTESKPVATPLDVGIKLKKCTETTEESSKKLPYRELVGALMYLATSTRPDIMFTVSYLSQFNECFDSSHWTAAKRVLRYLKGSIELGLSYRRSSDQLIGYVDADWANCPDDRKSYTGYAFILANGLVSWESRKQRTTALSSTEAEYMALAEATKEAIHLRHLLTDLGFSNLVQTKIYSDNRGAIMLAENPVFHRRSKHIDVRHHFIREVVQSQAVDLEHISTQDMGADMLTKSLSNPKHRKCLKILGILKS